MKRRRYQHHAIWIPAPKFHMKDAVEYLRDLYHANRLQTVSGNEYILSGFQSDYTIIPQLPIPENPHAAQAGQALCCSCRWCLSQRNKI